MAGIAIEPLADDDPDLQDATPVAPSIASPSTGGGGGTTDPRSYAEREAALMAAMAKAGHPIVKVSGTRTAKKQAELYAKGRSAPGPIVTEKSGAPGDESHHQNGTATDFAFVGPDGKPSYDPSHPWDTLGRMAKTQGFEWGGDWTTLVDRGHVQQPETPAPAAAPNSSPAPATASATGGPAPAPTGGVKIEPMTDADHKEAAQLPLWRQALDPIMEQAPFVAGATGGIVGGVMGAPTAAVSGPMGPAMSAVLGAGIGGNVGEHLRQLYRSWTGQEPHPGWVDSIKRGLGAGNTQMSQEMVGQGVGAAFAARAVGKPGAKEAAQATERYGLNLSGPEQSGSVIGRNLQKGMTYLSGAAKAATERARAIGDSNAIQSVRDALVNLTGTATQLSNREVGEAAQAGVQAGVKGLNDGPIGQLYQQTKKDGPNIDLRPQIRDLLQLFKDEGTPTAARRALLKLLPKPINAQVAPVSYRASDPWMVTFEQAAKLRTRLGATGRKALEPIGTDATSLATRWYGVLSDSLKDAHPDFETVSNLWRDARSSLANPFVKKIMSQSPDVVVKALGPTPSLNTIGALRDTMLRLASHNGVHTAEADAGIMAWQALRRQWFDRFVLRNAEGMPDPAGMLQRMTKANGAIHEMYGRDPLGQRVIDTAKDIATALSRRVKGPNALAVGIARGGEIYSAVTAAVQQGVAGAAEVVALTEAVPGFTVWLMHNPGAAKIATQALTGKGSVAGTKAISRMLMQYISQGGESPESTEGFEPYLDGEHDAPDPNSGSGGTASGGKP